jgi:hypothetical protein
MWLYGVISVASGIAAHVVGWYMLYQTRVGLVTQYDVDRDNFFGCALIVSGSMAVLMGAFALVLSPFLSRKD